MRPAAEMEYIFVYMKRFLLILFTSLSLILGSNATSAQVKIGYIDLEALMAQMPETKEVKKQVDVYQKQFIDQLTAMNDEYTAEPHDWPRKLTDSARMAIGIKLQAIQKKMEVLQNKSLKLIAAKKEELLKPLSDKAIAVLSEIAKENGISYVIDSSKGTRLIVSFVASDEINLMDAAKAKLGIR